MKAPTTAPSAITCTPSKTVALVDAIDEAYIHAIKLQALLLHTHGDSGDPFREMSGDVQDAYMWLCADLMGSIVAALKSSFSDGVKS